MMLEITAMFTLKRGLHFKRHILSSMACILIAAAMTPVLTAAHRPELTVLSSAGQDDQTETLAKYQKLLEDNPLSSLANDRIAELLFTQRKYQAVPMPVGLHCGATGIRAGPRSGATSNWVRFLI